MSAAFKFVGLPLIIALLFGAIDSANTAENSLGYKDQKDFRADTNTSAAQAS